MEEKIFGLSIEEYVEALEELGYTHEESVEIANNDFEWFSQTHKEFKLDDEEWKRIVDEFNEIGCTSFRMTADELKKIVEEHKW